MAKNDNSNDNRLQIMQDHIDELTAALQRERADAMNLRRQTA